jgi:hypothetical protein
MTQHLTANTNKADKYPISKAGVVTCTHDLLFLELRPSTAVTVFRRYLPFLLANTIRSYRLNLNKYNSYQLVYGCLVSFLFVVTHWEDVDSINKFGTESFLHEILSQHRSRMCCFRLFNDAFQLRKLGEEMAFLCLGQDQRSVPLLRRLYKQKQNFWGIQGDRPDDGGSKHL